jgi:DNA replication protein DnaC
MEISIIKEKNVETSTNWGSSQSATSQKAPVESPSDFMLEPLRADRDVVCPVCKGAGYLRNNVPFGHSLFGKIVPCQCKIAEIARKLQARTFSQWEANTAQMCEMETQIFALFKPEENGPAIEKAYWQARDYASTVIKKTIGHRSCLLIGPCGTGKTHLGCAICNAARNAGIGSLFVDASSFFPKLYAKKFAEDVLQQMIEVPILLLDDLDKMQRIDDGSFQRSIIHTLFDQRYKAHRPSIITANKDDSWEQWLDKSDRSRLFYGQEMAEFISTQGQDYRILLARKKLSMYQP